MYRLRLNFDKTKVMTGITIGVHATKWNEQNLTQVLHEDEAEKYLDRKQSFNRSYHIEFENRIKDSNGPTGAWVLR